MKYLIRLFSFILVLGLISCSTVYTYYKARNPVVAQCLSSCRQHFDACQHKCANSCRICKAKSNISTNIRYEKYYHQQKLQGMAVNRNVESYKDPLRCLKISCNCVADLDACEQACTGLVRKQLKANPLPDCV